MNRTDIIQTGRRSCIDLKNAVWHPVKACRRPVSGKEANRVYMENGRFTCELVTVSISRNKGSKS